MIIEIILKIFGFVFIGLLLWIIWCWRIEILIWIIRAFSAKYLDVRYDVSEHVRIQFEGPIRGEQYHIDVSHQDPIFNDPSILCDCDKIYYCHSKDEQKLLLYLKNMHNISFIREEIENNASLKKVIYLNTNLELKK